MVRTGQGPFQSPGLLGREFGAGSGPLLYPQEQEGFDGEGQGF